MSLFKKYLVNVTLNTVPNASKNPMHLLPVNKYTFYFRLNNGKAKTSKILQILNGLNKMQKCALNVKYLYTKARDVTI